ncbi:MAG: hypothetical protein MJZ23_05260 [Paludibacteraceae bacterium]|nr:hypothetical protein [Paludibacteraceae bacterium]
MKIDDIKYETPSRKLGEGEILVKKIQKYKNGLYVIYALTSSEPCVILSKYNKLDNINSLNKIKCDSVYFLEKDALFSDTNMMMYMEIKAFPYDNYYDIWLPDNLSIDEFFESKQLNGLFLKH